jgi:hypothetical protein
VLLAHAVLMGAIGMPAEFARKWRVFWSAAAKYAQKALFYGLPSASATLNPMKLGLNHLPAAGESSNMATLADSIAAPQLVVFFRSRLGRDRLG